MTIDGDEMTMWIVERRTTMMLGLLLMLVMGALNASNTAASCQAQGYTLMNAGQTMVVSPYYSVVFNGIDFKSGADGQHQPSYEIDQTGSGPAAEATWIETYANASVCASSQRPQDGNWAYIKADLIDTHSPCADLSYLTLYAGQSIRVGSWTVALRGAGLGSANIEIIDSSGATVNYGEVSATGTEDDAGIWHDGPNYTVTLPGGQIMKVQACAAGGMPGIMHARLRTWLSTGEISILNPNNTGCSNGKPSCLPGQRCMENQCFGTPTPNISAEVPAPAAPTHTEPPAPVNPPAPAPAPVVAPQGCRWNNSPCAYDSDCSFVATDATDSGICKPKQGCIYGTITCTDSQICDRSTNPNGVCKNTAFVPTNPRSVFPSSPNPPVPVPSIRGSETASFQNGFVMGGVATVAVVMGVLALGAMGWALRKWNGKKRRD